MTRPSPFLRRFLVPLAAGALLAACREPSRCDTGVCGTIVIGSGGDAATLFPPLVSSALDQTASDLIYLRLAEVGNELNTVGTEGFQPRLARSWKFEDSLTLVFELDERARWHDGTPVTAPDVAFTFDAFRDPQVNSPIRLLLDAISRVTARDSKTVEFRFRRAYPEQFFDATYHMRVLPRHLMDSIPRGRLASHQLARAPVGNGPYRFVSWKAQESLELLADTGFFLGRPGIARVIWRINPDASSLVNQLIAGEIDAIEHLLTPENIERGTSAPHLRLVEYPSIAYVYLDMNQRNPRDLRRPHPLFSDRDLRRALVQAVNRQEIVDLLLKGFGKVPIGPVSRFPLAGRDSSIGQAPYDTTRTNQALAALGWVDRDADGTRRKDGRRLEFELLVPIQSASRRRAAVILQDQLKQVGARVDIRELEFTVMVERTEKGNYDAALIGWNDDPTPSAVRQTFTTGAIGGMNYRAYSNPEFDRLVEQAVAERDPAAAPARWHEAYRVINEDAPAIWLFTPVQVTGIHRRFENVTIRPDQWAATLWTWRVAPGQAIPRDFAGPPPSPSPGATP